MKRWPKACPTRSTPQQADIWSSCPFLYSLVKDPRGSVRAMRMGNFVTTDLNLERHPIPPLWLRVAPSNSVRSPKDSVHHNITESTCRMPIEDN